MGIGTTTAILGSAAIGAGASYLSSREQADAVSDAERAQMGASREALAAQERANREALRYARETRDMQMGLSEPFRQFGIQQANFLGEIFGFNPVGQDSAFTPTPAEPQPSEPTQPPPAPLPGETDPRVADQNRYAQYVSSNPDLVAEWEAFTGRPGGRTFGPNLPATYDLDGDGNLSMDEYGAFHYDRFGRSEGRELPGVPGQPGANQGGQGANPGPAGTLPAGQAGGGMADAGLASVARSRSPGMETGPLIEMDQGGGAISRSPGVQVGGPIQMTGGSDMGVAGEEGPRTGGVVDDIGGGGPISTSPGFQVGAPIQGDAAQTGGPLTVYGVDTEAQARARQRFDGSMFADALNGQLADAATGIDANMAASGAVYSGSRNSAQALARSRYGMDALTRYISAGLGQPSTAGAQMGNNAAANFGATAGNLAIGQGNAAAGAAMNMGNIGANSAYARGNNTSNMLGNFANLGAYGLGAFSGAQPNAAQQVASSPYLPAAIFAA